jgi:triphosphoribosyl-dephospho-CoA synthase
LCGIGGLSHSSFDESPGALDLRDPGIQETVREKVVGLADLLRPSAGYDLLASELLSGYAIVREQSVEYLRWLGELEDPGKASAAVFGTLLGLYPDSLIARKAGQETAEKVRARAEGIMGSRVFTPEWTSGMRALDRDLRRRDLNPGTLADLTAGSIFLAILRGAG